MSSMSVIARAALTSVERARRPRPCWLDRPVLEHGDAGQLAPFQELEAAPPPVEMWVIFDGQAELLDRRHRVAAADHDRRALVGARRAR